MEGGEVADGPQSLHSLRSWYFSLNSCFSSCQSVINWRTSLNKEVCWKKLKLKQNDLSFFSVLYIKSPYSIEMNWQHINKNVYDEKGQGKSIRMTQEKSNNKKTEEMEKPETETLRVAWNLHITTSALVITFCNGSTTLQKKKQFLFSSEFRQRVYLITVSNGVTPHLQHKMSNERLVSNGNVNSSLPQTTQIWWFKVVVL